ncbi:beta-N-acetylhexosaminidase [Tropicibacter naphthalenivorans]|uniref:beta-N-acetylhexosaminidase n=1 Tax=Tropicibacter naphthalenivorans TaxID=441103 RepID=A0A0P1G655_9RHOB|nr:beta-N-acetylhexosaminidase [Tropicibacter naphthalenivorans]CUH77229.1 Beta-hexosaminidase [Tropicibacter naphthalenivorans]SMC59734.1 beta-N-acetylhexosaminidase [Tropicibacter naphthalenivorans]
MTAFGAAILGCEGLTLTKAEQGFFAGAHPFGFILFNRNLESAAQIRALCADLRSAVGWDAPIFIDQEGGRVQRLRPPLATEWLPPLEDVARYGAQAARAMELRFLITSLELCALGIDGNCVPTLDIARDETHAVLRNRCYGETLESVVEMGRAVVRGCQRGGVLPVMKHMPGHGLGTLDSHLELPRVATDRETLDTRDFAAFAAFADLPLGMSAHLVFEQIDPRPATISPVMIEVIRKQIGFQGLLMTDDISMQALSGTVAERGAAALAAGCDLVLHCNGDLEEMRALMGRVGRLSDPAQGRASAALATRTAPENLDICALRTELDALI